MRFILAALALGLSSSAHAQYAYVNSSVAGPPWGSAAPTDAMDLAFGAGGWDHLFFESANPATLFSGSYQVIYLEGGDTSADELYLFVQNNQAAMESWVSGGGGLLLNAAPNEGANQSWGFGGVTLNYQNNSTDPVTANNPTHPAWLGPALPTATSFTGNYVAHATVTGGGITPLMTGNNGGVHLAELAWGGGTAIFGGLTTTNYHYPTLEALDVRANLLVYIDNAIPDLDGDGILNGADNCPTVVNPTQVDWDVDGLGDACDACSFDPDNDIDADGVCGDVDLCPTVPDANQLDGDSDGLGDACDACANDPDNDIDADGVCGDVDNCPQIANPGQADTDGNGIGEACEGMTYPTGTGTGTGGTGTGGTATGGTATGGTATGATGATGTGTGTAPPAVDLGKIGCGCSTGSGGVGGWVLLPMALVGLRRRRATSAL